MSTAASRTLVLGVHVTSRRLSMSAPGRRIEILPGSDGNNYVALGNDAMNLIALGYHQGTDTLGCHAPGQLPHCGVVAHADQGVRNEHPHLIRSATNLVALLVDPGVTHRPSAYLPEVGRALSAVAPRRRASLCRLGDQALGVVRGQRHAGELQE